MANPNQGVNAALTTLESAQLLTAQFAAEHYGAIVQAAGEMEQVGEAIANCTNHKLAIGKNWGRHAPWELSRPWWLSAGSKWVLRAC